jgi:hypothetical protein
MSRFLPDTLKVIERWPYLSSATEPMTRRSFAPPSPR